MAGTKGLAASGALLLLAGCGEAPPEPVRQGPRLAAQLERTWDFAGSPARQSAFSKDGTLLAASSAAGAIVVRRTADWGTAFRVDHPGGAAALAFAPDGRRLFSAGYDGAVRAWDLRSPRASTLIGRANGTVWSLHVAPDGRRLAAAGEDMLIRIWPLAGSGPPRVLAGHERNVWEVRFSPDGRRLASGSFDASARLWDAVSGRQISRIAGHGEAVVGLDYSPKGEAIATGSDDSTVRLWRAGDGTPLRTMRSGNHAYKVAFSPDGRWLASAGRARGGLGTLWHQLTGSSGEAAPVRLWRVADGALIQALPHPDDVMYVAFSPDGRFLATGGEDGKVRLWRLGEAR